MLIGADTSLPVVITRYQLRHDRDGSATIPPSIPLYRGTAMSDNQSTTVRLKQRQLDYLTEMAEKYSLPDADKSLRCLIDFAIEKRDLEQSIYGEIRCRDC